MEARENLRGAMRSDARLRRRCPLDRAYVLAYTALFAMTALAAFAPFIVGHKSLIWNLDGINQHFPALVYLGQWLRDVLRTLFVEHSLDIPLWDPTIGYGADIVGTLHYYVLGDPLALLSALVPPQHTELLYDALVIARMYLAGLFFSLYCRHRGHARGAVLGGSIAYVFCGWTLFAAVRHPFFMNPLVYLPLLALGVDQVFEGKGPVLLIAMLAMSAASNFYFFYMLAFAVAVYAFARYCCLPDADRSAGQLLRWLGRFLCYGITGALMAAAVILPAIMLFVSGGRSGVSILHDALYSGGYYAHLVSSLAGSASADTWAILGFSAPVVPALIALFTGSSRSRERTVLKVSIAALFLLLLVPAAGSALNGFSYVSNRWCWILAAACAYALVRAWPELLHPTRRQQVTVAVGSALYIAAVLALRHVTGDRNLIELALIAATVAVVALAHPIARRCGTVGLAAIVIALACAGSVGTAYDLYSNRAKGYVASFLDAGTAYDRLAGSPFSQVPADGHVNTPLAATGADGVGDGPNDAGSDTGSGSSASSGDNGQASNTSGAASFGRTEVTFATPREDNWYFNASALAGVPSTQSYFSLSNGAVADLLEDVGITDWLSFRYQNVGGRTALQALLNVRYAIVPKGQPAPNGFSLARAYSWQNGEYELYCNNDPLPFGFVYDGYLAPERYAKLDTVQRQQALLGGILLEGDRADDARSELAEASTATDEREVLYTVEPGKGVEQTGHSSFTVSKAGARVTLRFQGLAQAETYLAADGASVSLRRDLDPQVSTWSSNRFKINVTSGTKESGDAVSRSFTYATPYSPYTLGQQDFLVNLGYSDAARTEVQVTFPAPGSYRFDRLRVVCQPLESIRTAAAQRASEHLENVAFGTNRITGDIRTTGTRAVFLSLPYDRGWTACVDGREVPLYRANRMGMAFLVDAGSHRVELRYETYGLRWGIAASGIGFGAFAVTALRWHRKRRRRKNAGA